MVVSDTRDDRALDTGTWIFAAGGTRGGAARRAAPPPSTGRPPTWPSAGGGTAETECPGPDAAVRPAGRATATGMLATVVTSASLAPYRQVQRLAWVGSAALALGLLVVVHLVLRANVGAGAAAGAADERAGGPLERRGRRAPVRVGPAARRARTISPAPWTACWTGCRRCCARTAALRRAAHELRTPLARVQAEVDLLGSRPPGRCRARPGAGHDRRGGRIDARHPRDADDDGTRGRAAPTGRCAAAGGAGPAGRAAAGAPSGRRGRGGGAGAPDGGRGGGAAGAGRLTGARQRRPPCRGPGVAVRGAGRLRRAACG